MSFSLSHHKLFPSVYLQATGSAAVCSACQTVPPRHDFPLTWVPSSYGPGTLLFSWPHCLSEKQDCLTEQKTPVKFEFQINGKYLVYYSNTKNTIYCSSEIQISDELNLTGHFIFLFTKPDTPLTLYPLPHFSFAAQPTEMCFLPLPIY